MASPVIQFKRGVIANLPALRAGEPGFTTDSYDLYVGIDSTTSNNKYFGSARYWTKETASSATVLKLLEASGNGTSNIGLRAPASVGTALTYTFPGTATDGYFLKTDATGTLSWTGTIVATGDDHDLAGTTDLDEVSVSGFSTFSKNVDIAGITSTQDLYVAGISTFIGECTFKGGTVTLGDATADNVVFGADVNSNIIPNTDDTYDLGSSSQQWRDLFINGTVDADSLVVSGIATLGSFIDINDSINISDGLEVTGFSTFTKFVDINESVDIAGGATVTGLSTFSSNVDINSDVDINRSLAVTGGSTVSGLSTFSSNVDINSDVDINRSLTVTGGATVSGFSTFTKFVDINESADISGGVTVTGVSTLGGFVDINDSVNISNGLEVTGVSTFTGNIDINSDVDINRSLAVTGGTTVTGLSTFSSNVDINSDVDINRSLAVTGGTTISGLSTFSGNVDINSDVDINRSLAVTGGSTVTGLSTFTGNVDVNSDVDINRSLAVTGGTTVTGLSTFSSNIDVNSDVDINRSLAVTGGATVSGFSTFTKFVDINESADISGGLNVAGITSAPTAVVTSLQASNIKANDGTTAMTITNSTGAVEFAQNFTVSGNMYVNGSTTQVNTSQTTIEDQLLELGMVDGSVPDSDLNKDIGVLFNYFTDAAKKAGVYWDDSTSRIVAASVVTESTGVLSASSYADFEVGGLFVNGCTGSATQVINCSSSTVILENITIDGGAF